MTEPHAGQDNRFIAISVPMIGEAEKQAVLEVLDSGMLVQGSRVERLEERFAALVGVRHAVATSSGTTALHLALLAHGIGPGDEVITSPLSFVATANSILYVGAVPVFADVHLDTFNLDPRSVEQLIGPRTRAIMPVHLYGQPCDMAALSALASEHGLILIEDSAQAVGASYRGRPVGSFGTGVFSLYATKNITSAEGGIITTDDEELASQVRRLRNHGMSQRYQYSGLGYNHRLTDLHAAIALSQMDRLDLFTETRQSNAAALSAGITSVRTPVTAPDRVHVWHQYTVRVEHADRDQYARRLNAAGIGAGVYYPQLLDELDHVRAVSGAGTHPVAERLTREVLSLPVHPALSTENLDRIITEVNRL